MHNVSVMMCVYLSYMAWLCWLWFCTLDLFIFLDSDCMVGFEMDWPCSACYVFELCLRWFGCVMMWIVGLGYVNCHEHYIVCVVWIVMIRTSHEKYMVYVCELSYVFKFYIWSDVELMYVVFLQVDNMTWTWWCKFGHVWHGMIILDMNLVTLEAIWL